jgi:hypothetical protein
MIDSFMGCCGIDCNSCNYKMQMSCPGCQATKGKPFWGECLLATCCTQKGHDHCGQCQEFPCAKLNEYSYDNEHGDNGQRIRNLESRNKKGYDAWRRKQDTQS